MAEQNRDVRQSSLRLLRAVIQFRIGIGNLKLVIAMTRLQPRSGGLLDPGEDSGETEER